MILVGSSSTLIVVETPSEQVVAELADNQDKLLVDNILGNWVEDREASHPEEGHVHIQEEAGVDVHNNKDYEEVKEDPEACTSARPSVAEM
mmetsp:Transcript_17815/g.25245  ORF Transcript_17815/g.25245 Transcript_17815/m.25245 type:complete len:91 (-) Transcript_17815:1536-1808(-)